LIQQSFPIPKIIYPQNQIVSDTPRTHIELYEFKEGGQDYSSYVARLRKKDLAHLIANLIKLSEKLISNFPDLKVELTNRWSSYKHQYESPECSLKVCAELRARLKDHTNFDEIERIIASVEVTLNGGLKERLRKIEQTQPLRLIHGDLTENNILVTDEKLYLLDWDNCRLLPSGHFDLAFALVRLAVPRRHGSTHILTSEEVEAARELCEYVRQECAPSNTPNDQSIAYGLDQVSFEFMLRMIECLYLYAEDNTAPFDMSYLCRCDPSRPQQLKKELFPNIR
jgi:thiamine kinase-like enzyme